MRSQGYNCEAEAEALSMAMASLERERMLAKITGRVKLRSEIISELPCLQRQHCFTHTQNQ